MTANGQDLERIRALIDNIGSVLLGKEDVVRLAVLALLAEGHLLIEDVPGVGKTTLAQALARSIDGTFKRIQFTSDLLPSDILGVSVFFPEAGDFQFKKGPVFANVVLADEINRATPKTQSALLEAMNERRVTMDNVTHQLPAPFLVLATQNPVEYHGTFPLPESQLDRFLMRIRVGYPDPGEERRILMQSRGPEAVERLAPVISVTEVRGAQPARPAGGSGGEPPRLHHGDRHRFTPLPGHPGGGESPRLAGAVPGRPSPGVPVRPGLLRPRRRETCGRARALPPRHPEKEIRPPDGYPGGG